MHDVDAAWFAGLYEGEGCVCYVIDKRNTNTGTMKLYIESTDKDIIDKIVSLVGGKVWHSFPPSKPKHYKDSWRWGVSSMPEVKRIIDIVLPYLGERRSAKCREILDIIESKKRDIT